jgi:hypothetical protein
MILPWWFEKHPRNSTGCDQLDQLDQLQTKTPSGSPAPNKFLQLPSKSSDPAVNSAPLSQWIHHGAMTDTTKTSKTSG